MGLLMEREVVYFLLQDGHTPKTSHISLNELVKTEGLKMEENTKQAPDWSCREERGAGVGSS